MAIKPLKTIKFPGLSDTYTIPQVDSTPTQGSTNAVSSGGVYSALHDTDTTLSQSGQAADAKETGDRFERVNAQIEDIVDQTEFVKSTYTATLVIGAISNTGGNNVAFTKTIRTNLFQSIANPLAIRMLNDNWRVAVYWYAGHNPNWQFIGREPYFTAQDSRINITAETARKGFTSATFIRVVFFRWTGTDVDTDTDVTQEELSTFNDNYVFENLENLETHLADIKKDARTIYICASDSADSDKAYADYVCTGTNDEVILQQAVTSAGVTNRNIVLACGNYYIDAFPFEDASGIKVAVSIGLGTSSRTSTSVIDISGSAYGSIRKYGTSSDFFRGAIFNIRQTAYESLDSNTQYAIFAGVSTLQGKRIYPFIKTKISNIAFKLHGNQKKIICIDGWFMSALSIDNVFGMAITANSGSSTTGNIPPEDLVIPVPGCIGVRGMQGSCFGVNNLWENSFMWGFYAGFHVVGEHIIGLSLGARFCNYGYVFGIVDGEWEGTLAHPNTLINCCDELDFNLPLFGNGGRYDAIAKQSVTLMDFNIERIPSYSALGGDLAKEVTAGNGYGDITFSAVTAYGSSYVNAPFWADGHGENFKTRNTLHAIGGSTALRNTYRPTYMQMYYDADLGKLLIYNGSDWVDTSGNEVTP